MTNLSSKIVTKISSTLGITNDYVPLHAPRFEGNEIQYLKECIDSTYVSSVGKYEYI